MKTICICTTLVILLMGCDQKNKSTKIEEIMIRQIDPKALKIGFVLTNGFYTTEFTGPLDVFNHANWSNKKVDVFSISEGALPVKSAEGVKILPDFSFENTPPIDILVIPSGVNTRKVDLENKKLMNFLNEKGNAARHVMSLCEGAFALAESGLLDKHEATTYPSEIHDLRENYPDLKVKEGVSFVHDGKMVTSVGEAKSFEAALYLMSKIFDDKTANEIAEGLLVDWGWRPAAENKIEK